MGATPITISTDFKQFLEPLDSQYQEKLKSLALFDASIASGWTTAQKKTFATVFYHIRGYFIDFMWFVANHSSNYAVKTTVLENIAEELGGPNQCSHEQLYSDFAKEWGVNIQDEFIFKANYPDFAKEFNHTHLLWLKDASEDERFAAFAAYERLDNLDYPLLYKLMTHFNLPLKAVKFFKVHSYVEHFDATLPLIEPLWKKSPEKVKRAFDFIYLHQEKMWRTFSSFIESL